MLKGCIGLVGEEFKWGQRIQSDLVDVGFGAPCGCQHCCPGI